MSFKKEEALALGKRRSQLESHVTEESALHPTLAFAVEMQTATSEIAVLAGQIENAIEFNDDVNLRLCKLKRVRHEMNDRNFYNWD